MMTCNKERSFKLANAVTLQLEYSHVQRSMERIMFWPPKEVLHACEVMSCAGITCITCRCGNKNEASHASGSRTCTCERDVGVPGRFGD